MFPAGESTAELTALSRSLPAILKPGPALDVPQFCRLNGLRDAVESWYQLSGASTANDTSVIQDAWTGTLIPTLEARRAVFNTYADKASRDALVSARPFTNAESVACKKRIAEFKQGEMDQAGVARATAMQSAYFCKDVTFLHLNKCTQLVPVLMEIMKPRGDMNLFGTWEIVLTEPAYLKVLTKIVARNLRYVEKNETPSSRLFDDLVAAFTTELGDKEKALEATFNLLGVLASNGNNSYEFVPCQGAARNSGFENALKILGVTNSLLDRLTAAKGFLYTFPKEVDALCDYGKGYHFWMAAYLARQGALRSGDAVAAAAAAFTLNKGYQFMKKDNGRDPRKAFTENIFSNYLNNMRLDMTEAAAGAWFGALSVRHDGGTITQTQFDAGLRLMFDGVKETPRTPSFEFPSEADVKKLLATYSLWKKTMNPDAAFGYFQNVVGK
jgi:hypothetical protein